MLGIPSTLMTLCSVYLCINLNYQLKYTLKSGNFYFFSEKKIENIEKRFNWISSFQSKFYYVKFLWSYPCRWNNTRKWEIARFMKVSTKKQSFENDVNDFAIKQFNSLSRKSTKNSRWVIQYDSHFTLVWNIFVGYNLVYLAFGMYPLDVFSMHVL